MAQPLVSLITPSYNKAAFIAETIDSVQAQTYQNWELIVVDDLSSDKTVEIAKKAAENENRIKVFVNATNMGANYSRNLGIKKAAGEYIIFLDADDLLGHRCVESRVKVALQNPLANLLIFPMAVFNSKVGDDDRKWNPVSDSPLQEFLQHKLPWSILQSFWKKELLLKLNGFDETFKRLQDVELNTRALLDKDLRYISVRGEADCYYRIDEARKNFNTDEFMIRWVESAIKYCNKFEGLVPPHLRSYLVGTIYQTYLQVIYYFKTKKINRENFISLERALLGSQMVLGLSPFNRALLRFSRQYNLYFIRIPGINRGILNKLTS